MTLKPLPLSPRPCPSGPCGWPRAARGSNGPADSPGPDGSSGGPVCFEDGIDPEVVAQLKAMGHDVSILTGHDRAVFGRAQIITRDPMSGVLCGGSDGRADGMAIGF